MRQLPAIIAGATLGTVLAMLAICSVELHRQLFLAQTKLAMVESSCLEMKNEMVTLREQHDELQSWRTQVTAASRMGWSQAHRFIREFPLWTAEEVE